MQDLRDDILLVLLAELGEQKYEHVTDLIMGVIARWAADEPRG